MNLPAPLRRHWVWLVTTALFVGAAFLRFHRVDESLHVDSLHWYRRSHQFYDAFGAGDWASTRLAPHPGVIMMWVAGGIMKLNGSFDRGGIDEQSLFALKFLGAFVGALAAALSFPLLRAISGPSAWRPALVVSVLFATEPQLLEHSRMAHLDMASLGFAWLGVLLAVLAYERSSPRWALGAGVLFGLGVLTKLAIAPLPAGMMLILLGACAVSKFRDRRGLWVAVWATLATLVTVYALWPALWKTPIETLKYVVTTSEQVVEAGHRLVVNGRRTKNAGVDFYGRLLLFSTPHEVSLAAVLGLGSLWFVRDLRKHYGWLALAFVPYLVVICLAKKKLTRYVLPASVPLVLLASVGLEWLLRRLPRLPLKGLRAPQLAAAALLVLTVGRTVRAVSELPSSVHCAHWPGAEECGRPGDRYFYRDLAIVMKRDWQERGRKGKPSVYGVNPKLTAPWLQVKAAKSPAKADYVVLWDGDYRDERATKVSKKTKRALRGAKLGRELHTLHYRGAFVARLLVGPR